MREKSERKQKQYDVRALISNALCIHIHAYHLPLLSSASSAELKNERMNEQSEKIIDKEETNQREKELAHHTLSTMQSHMTRSTACQSTATNTHAHIQSRIHQNDG